MNLIEMGGRPGTPSKERLRIADTLISQDSQAHQRDPEHHVPVWDQPGELNPAYQDAKMLLDYLDIYQFSMAAHETMEELHKAEQINSNVDLLPIVAQGSDEKFIGMIIDRGEPDTGQADPKETASEQTDEDGYGIVITCLYRHPEWIGLNEQFPWCRGLEVHIFSYRDTPEEPCIIIAVRPGNMEEVTGDPEHPPPPGEINTALHDAVTWHGAVNCRWYTGQKDRPRDKEDEIQKE